MPVLSAVLLIFSFQFNLLFFNAAPVLQRTVGFNTQYRTSDFAENLGRYLSCTERTSQGKDFELILTVKIETRHPVEGPFGSEFRAICNHCGVMTAWSRKTWKFCEQFVRFFWKNDPTKLSQLRGSRQKSAMASPTFGLTLFQISSKSVHFRRSYCRTREDRLCSVEYFQHGLLEARA